MEKRLILVIILSALIMMFWSVLIRRYYPIEKQKVTEKALLLPPSIPPENKTEFLESIISFQRKLVFHLPSATLREIVFQKFGGYSFCLEEGFYLLDKLNNQTGFKKQKINSLEAVFVLEDEKKRITKHFYFSNPNYIIDLDIKIENLSQDSLSFSPSFILGRLKPDSNQLDSRFREIFVKEPDKIKIVRLKLAGYNNIQPGEFFGWRERYFCMLVQPSTPFEKLQVRQFNSREYQAELISPEINVQIGQIGHFQYQVYLGPQQADLLKSFKNGAEEIIYYGFFDPIAKLLLSFLRFLFGLVHNWGWAIVLLSIFIYIILFPLSLKQMRSAKEMQELQPKVAELRQAFKDNPQKLNKEILELYRQHKINPLGGCLPMLLQIPIFFALYQGLMRTVELKGAHFLWIKDLSQPDRLFASPEINILPVLMAITMFLQQRLSLTPMSGSSGEQQKLMTFLFPILFGIIFYRMPAGLVLYWFTNSLLMLIYQLRMQKLTHSATP